MGHGRRHRKLAHAPSLPRSRLQRADLLADIRAVAQQRGEAALREEWVKAAFLPDR